MSHIKIDQNIRKVKKKIHYAVKFDLNMICLSLTGEAHVLPK